MTILVVDDNMGVRRLLCSVAGEVASGICECSDGADALESYTAHRPSLVLMDIRMPRMDGLAATRQIVNAYPAARIVIVTDYDDDELRTAAREAGACGYALKQNLVGLPDLLRSLTGSGT